MDKQIFDRSWAGARGGGTNVWPSWGQLGVNLKPTWEQPERQNTTFCLLNGRSSVKGKFTEERTQDELGAILKVF